ncbi:MAG TPA: hypothetical protein VLB44_21855 [Kofleriaceae bacterium]|nr:hypothetical protein [Kofleriaceae bacterium]
MIARCFVVLLAACGGAPPVASCEDKLDGAWATPAGAIAVVDRGATLEAYPLFRDLPAASSAAIVVAPRAIDLRRAGGKLEGTVSRRYMRGSRACTGRAPIHVVSCGAEGLSVIVADPSEPGFAETELEACLQVPPGPSRRETWTRD